MSDFPVQMTGPLLFSQLANWMLYGILCVQIYVYSYNFPDDRRSLKFLVYFVFFLETIQTALTGADIYYWFVAGFGDGNNLANGHFSAIDNMIMNAPISFIAQGFYCHRIWALNKRWWWLSIVIAILSLLQAVASVISGITATIIQGYVDLSPVLYIWFFASSLADIGIVVAMTLLLRRMSGCGGYSRYIVPRVLRLIIETNALTTATTIMSFVLCFYLATQVYPLFLTGVIGKLFSNSLFLTLNNRIYFRDHPPPTSCEYHSTHDGSNLQPGAATSPRLPRFVRTTPSQSVATISYTSARAYSIEVLPAVEEDAQNGNKDVVIGDSGSR